MAIINEYGFPFSSVSNDRQYSAEEWREYFGTLIKDGVVQNSLNECKVKSQTIPNKTVFVDAGTVFIQGAIRILGTAQTLSVDDNTSGNPRIDRIVARLNFTERKIEFAVLKGTPASSPVATSLTRNTSVWELALADITLSNGFSTITEAAITDQRQDIDLCGAASMTIGVIPPSGSEAETVTLSMETAEAFGVINADAALSLVNLARFYGKYSQMSGGSAKSGAAQSGIIAFSTEDNDDFSAINIGASNSRIVIPNGIAKAKFYWKGECNGGVNSGVVIKLYKNGAYFTDITKIAAGNYAATSTSGCFYTNPVSCEENDYFEVYVTLSTDQTSSSISSGSIFGMEVIA